MRRCLLILLVFLLPGIAGAAPPERFLSVFRDGSTATTVGHPPWNDIGERDLILIRDRHAQPRLAAPYIELANGDILPGLVAGYEPRDPRFGHLPTLYIAPEVPLEALRGGKIAIRPERVRRIVTTRAQTTAAAPFIAMTDGRQFQPRSLRLTATGVTFLGDSGLVSASFSEIADALFVSDRTLAVLEDSASTDESAKLVRLTTLEGAQLTGSRFYRPEQRRERSRRGFRYGTTTAGPQTAVQPSWAREPLAMPEASICQSSFRRPDEVPLSLLNVTALAERGGIGAAQAWQRDAGVSGAPLASGASAADFGIGMHAHCELAFDLPPQARTLSLAVGIDRASAAGGCVICKVRRDTADGAVLWQSSYLRGSDGAQQVGPLNVEGIARIVLVAETAHAGRPAGADPLDIRDDVAWLSPLVTISGAERLNPQVARSLLAGLDEWEFASDGDEPRYTHVWNSYAGRWDALLRLESDSTLTLSREVAITPHYDVLEFVTSSPARGDAEALVVKVDGEELFWTASRDRDRSIESRRLRGPSDEGDALRDDAIHYWWDLSSYRGKKVKLSFELRPGGDTNIAWQALGLRSAVANLPARGKLPAPEVPLASLAALELVSQRDRELPKLDALPGRRGPIRFVGQAFSGGYGMKRSSSVSFTVSPEYRSFVALAGTCTEQSGPLRILLNGQVAWEQKTRSAAAGAEWIEVPLPPGTTKLTLESGADGGYEGYSAFASAGFRR